MEFADGASHRLEINMWKAEMEIKFADRECFKFHKKCEHDSSTAYHCVCSRSLEKRSTFTVRRYAFMVAEPTREGSIKIPREEAKTQGRKKKVKKKERRK